MSEARYLTVLSTVPLIGLWATPLLAEDGDDNDWRSDTRYLNRTVVELSARHRSFEPGHPDFGAAAINGAGRYVNIAHDTLDDDRRPSFNSSGYMVQSPRRDASGAAIMFQRPYIESLTGDVGGSYDSEAGGSVKSPSSFGQWFRDTPGVNAGERAVVQMAFDHESRTYKFDGPLGDGGDIAFMGVNGDGPSTCEMATLFIHSAGDGWYFETETDADVWVYIDGHLVIDGGSGTGETGGSGADGVDDFEIEDGVVIPGEPFAAEIRVLGAAIQNSSYHLPVTTRLRVGDGSFAPFGAYEDAIRGNVNDDQSATGWANPGANPRRFVLPNVFEGGTPITLEGSSWSREWSRRTRQSSWRSHMSCDTAVGTPQIRVLRDGDAVPNIQGAFSQGDVASFVAAYVDEEGGTISLESNQVIYLFELGVSASSSSADYQDLVVLVTLAEDTSYFDGGDPDDPEAVPAPSMTQRIELDRLWWLEDGRTYDLRVFYADRDGMESRLRMETNAWTLNLAQRPELLVLVD